jgi:hypothetical protein
MRLMTAEPETAVPSEVMPGSRASGRVTALLEENGTLVLALCAAAFIVLSRIPGGLAQDGWTALLAGREIARHGLPAHDTLTVWANGRRWIDQQWLAQLALYGLQRLGGIRLVMLVHAVLASGALAAAAVLARRRGASALSVTWVAPLVLFAYLPEAVVMRTQSFAYPLFVAVLALLVRDGRHPSRRIYLVFPLLALWANVHGSVLVGAALVSVYGLIGLARSARAGLSTTPRPLLLVLVPWACMLASPYATSLPSYYERVLIGGHFSSYVSEWAPTRLSLATAPLYLLVVGGAWLFGRVRGRITAFDLCAFFGTALMSFQAERNMAWFGLVALVVLPRLLDQLRAPAAPPRRLNRLLAAAALAAIALVAVGVATRSTAWFLSHYPATAANAAAAAAGSTGHTFANEAYSDWLIWSHPELAGRIAFDSRFELLTLPQMQSVVDFRGRAGDWRATAADYDVLVLSAKSDRGVVASLLGAHDARLVAYAGGVVVLRRGRHR